MSVILRCVVSEWLKSLSTWQMLSSCMLDTGMSTSIDGYLKALKISLCLV